MLSKSKLSMALDLMGGWGFSVSLGGDFGQGNCVTVVMQRGGDGKMAGLIKASVIIPVLNEAEQLAELLVELQPLRGHGVELVLVDGGSSDSSRRLAIGLVDQLLESSAGRAIQMNRGAATAGGEWLFFLHADTRLTTASRQALLELLERDKACWGRFDVQISGRHPLLGLVARMMNVRSRLTGIATGDQLMFVHRVLFDAVGGFVEQPLMEDIELSKCLKAVNRPLCLPQRVITSGRRWDQRGFWPTVVLMWRLRWCYWWGVPAEQLARQYR